MKFNNNSSDWLTVLPFIKSIQIILEDSSKDVPPKQENKHVFSTHQTIYAKPKRSTRKLSPLVELKVLNPPNPSKPTPKHMTKATLLLLLIVFG